MPARTNIQETQSGDFARYLSLRIQSERLAEECGVSKMVTREVVGRLVAIGRPEGRKGKGLVVRRPDPLHLKEPANAIHD